MIDIEALKVVALVILIAVIATILRRRIGLVEVLTAIIIGLVIAGTIVAMRTLREAERKAEEAVKTIEAARQEAMKGMRKSLSGQIPPTVNFQPQLPSVRPPIIYPPMPTEILEEEAFEDELWDDEWDDYGSDE
jgi:hypothetical protein